MVDAVGLVVKYTWHMAMNHSLRLILPPKMEPLSKASFHLKGI